MAYNGRMVEIVISRLCYAPVTEEKSINDSREMLKHGELFFSLFSAFNDRQRELISV